MRWFYALFWIVVAVGLYYSFNNYNTHLNDVQAAKGPTQQHYYFNNHSENTTTLTPPSAAADGANVKQVGFSVTQGSPSPGQFTCHVALKNYGNQKATSIQVQITPFRNVLVERDNDNHSDFRKQPVVNPTAQISAWLLFPDLDPGQEMTRDTVFPSVDGAGVGDNLHPQILFKSVKPEAPKPASAPTP